MPNKISVKLSEPINLSPDGTHCNARKWLVKCTDHPWVEAAAVSAMPGLPLTGIAPGFWGFEFAWNYAESHVIAYHKPPADPRRGPFDPRTRPVLHPEDDDRDHRNVNYPETWRF